MAKEKNVFHSLEEFREAMSEERADYSEKVELLRKYGLELDDLDMSDVEILEEDEDGYSLTFRNKSTNEVYCSNLMVSLSHPLFETNNVVAYSIVKNNVKEQYWHTISYEIKPRRTKALKARRNPENLLFSRAYVDVETKYGDFCLHIEKGGNLCCISPYSFLALYHGKAEEIMEYNNFVFRQEGALKHTLFEKDNFSGWQIGNAKFDEVKKHRYIYGQLPDDKGSSLYAIRMLSKGFIGMIVDSGEITDNVSYEYEPIDYHSDMFEFLYSKNYYSKAFFLLDGLHGLEIIKDDNGILVGYRTRQNCRLNEVFLMKLSTLVKGRLSSDELLSIVNVLKAKSSDELVSMVCDELEIYENISKNLNDNNEVQDVVQLSSPFMLPIVDWDMAVETLRNSDPVKLTEDIIENYSRELGVTIDDIIGIEDKTQIEEHKSWVKQIKHNNV